MTSGSQMLNTKPTVSLKEANHKTAHSASSATQKTLLKEAPLPYPYQALVRSVSASWNRAITDSETSWDFHRAPGVHTRGRSAAVQGVVHGVHNQISGIPRGR
ncbi:unnamed protein product [Prunus armeniaca]